MNECPVNHSIRGPLSLGTIFCDIPFRVILVTSKLKQKVGGKFRNKHLHGIHISRIFQCILGFISTVIFYDICGSDFKKIVLKIEIQIQRAERKLSIASV